MAKYWWVIIFHTGPEFVEYLSDSQISKDATLAALSISRKKDMSCWALEFNDMTNLLMTSTTEHASDQSTVSPLKATPTLPATQALSSSHCSWYRFAIKFRLARWRHWDVFLLCAASLQRRIARIYLLSPGVFRVSFLPTSLLSDLFVVFCSYALLRRIKQGRVTSNAKGKTIVVVDSGYRQRPVRAGNKNI